MNRQETLEHLRNHPEVSVLVVGGGINGISTFRELAINGVDVLLVERGDFCSGASSASSHMAHGGIRYLENGEFRLVKEAVQERNRMLQNAPHIVKPLPTAVPIFKYLSGLLNAPIKFFGKLDKPAERGSLVIKIGLIFYDTYTGIQRVVPKHKFFSRKKSLATWARLNPSVVNTAVYYDGAILQPERLAVELLLDAEVENTKANAVNYMSMVGGSRNIVILRDELTDENFEIKPKVVVNATGVWIDSSNHKLGFSSNFIGGSKGSHVVIDHDELREAIGDHEFFFENHDGRIVLIYPLFDRVLIGTSDIPVDSPEDVLCTEEEIEYFLEMVKRVFPDLNVTHQNIVFQFSGIRPLPRSVGKNVSQISRDHSIEVLSGDWTGLQFPVYSLVGGKWTSFRAFGEQTADKVMDYIGCERKTYTRSLAIGGGRGYISDPDEVERQVIGLTAWTGLGKERITTLYERYGTRVEVIASFINQGRDEMLKSVPYYSTREIVFLVQNEKVVHLDDLILRRSMLAMLGRITRDGVKELSDVMGQALEWDIERKAAEVERTLSILARRHGVQL